MVARAFPSGPKVSFPCWVIEHQDVHENGFLAARNEQRDGEVAAVIITNLAAAESHAEFQYVPREIPDALSMLGMLALLEAKGFTHVAFNLSLREKGAFSVTIQKLRIRVLGAFDGIPGKAGRAAG